MRQGVRMGHFLGSVCMRVIGLTPLSEIDGGMLLLSFFTVYKVSRSVRMYGKKYTGGGGVGLSPVPTLSCICISKLIRLYTLNR